MKWTALIYYKKATKFCEISTVDLSYYVLSNNQIYSGDFAKFCGLLRIYELYHKICPFFSVNKIYSHAEVDEEVEEGLVEIEHPEEEEQIMLTWDDCGYSVTPKPLADIAARAKEGSSEDKAILDYYRQ